jgi:hypothetical protein
MLAAAAAQSHLSPFAVALVLIVLAAVWVISLLLWPLAPCRHCGGRGKNAGSTGRRWGKCRHCGGSGSRQRLGSRLARKIVSRQGRARGS